jgi:hypothetical protein
MTKSATDVMQEVIVSAVLDAIDALKGASKGMPNTLLRDINAIHANAAFADLPKELQAAIAASVRSAFNRLLKEGYSVSPGRAEPTRAATHDRRGPPRDGRPAGAHRPSGPRRPTGPGKPPSRGGRPPQKPKG